MGSHHGTASGLREVTAPAVDLVWIPLGAGEASPLVRWSGRGFERLVAHRDHRRPQPLFHSALQVHLDGVAHVVEMTPAWGQSPRERGVVAQGPVGARLLGRSRLFRYEVRRWPGGVIPDLGACEQGPRRLRTDAWRARRLLELVPCFPAATWGRDALGAGEMWNSNSLTAWLLARSGHRTAQLRPPDEGRAPGWSAGLVVAARQRDEGPLVAAQRP